MQLTDNAVLSTGDIRRRPGHRSDDAVNGEAV